MENNKNGFVVPLLIIVSALIAIGGSVYFYVKKDSSNSNTTTTNTLVGNDRDTHGCIGSAGYSWCEIKNKCLRIWEEKCEITTTTSTSSIIACTADAKLCPDGSSVGRKGPNCEFAKCPAPKTVQANKDTVSTSIDDYTSKQGTSSEKFFVNFPWTKGEQWEFVTGFHDENCVDFKNLDNPKVPVLAAADGEVVLSTHSYPDEFNTYSPIKTHKFEDMGNFVIIYHKPQTFTVYMHFQQELTPPVKRGDKVRAGQRIGYEGNTGWSNRTHLHFCVVDVSIFPETKFIAKPLDSWGFSELNGSNDLLLNQKYTSEN